MHRTANVNEYSTRYSEAIDSRDTAPKGQWRAQSTSNKQGSDGFVNEWPDGAEGRDEYLEGTGISAEEIANFLPGDYLSIREQVFHQLATDIYEERLEFGVAKEVARKDLPLSTYTEAYWKIDLHNLFHFLGLRMDPHAQKEIRDYAVIMGEEIVSKVCPVAWEAFRDYRLNAMFLTALDLEVVKRLLNAAEEARLRAAESAGVTVAAAAYYMPPYSQSIFMQHGQLDCWRDKKNCRERDECLKKLQRMGLVV